MVRRIYIAGPYNAKTTEQVLDNIAKAEFAAAEFVSNGDYIYIPHKATALMGAKEIDEEYFYKLHIDILKKWASHVYFIKGWKGSVGCLRELKAAYKFKKMVIFEEER